ncbi:TetR-like C-terminal domain-containing protein [Acutalibacter sp. 1XD8-33]|uniref:TetR-like C-terminal domain-containing protein n=1 Tax=Acutalibacter sp. 1XD8-33 TaxID=2320081 RepID=UPI0011C4A7D2|nr:TetR-like C-terminal domain-containing protein [Acutalibacter sp. 1XD8-33]
MPYLAFIRDSKRVLWASVEQSAVLRLQSHCEGMFRQVFAPILERFQVPERDRHYTMTFYLHGITALVMEWLKNDCRESIEEIADIIMRNIARPEVPQTKKRG